MKNSQFSTNISEMIQDRTNKNSQSIYRTVPYSVTLNDPDPDFKGTPFY